MPAAELPGGDELASLAASLRSVRFPDWLRAALDPREVGRELGPRIGEVVPGAETLVDLRLDDARALTQHWSLRFAADVTTADGVRTAAVVARRPPPSGRLPEGEGWEGVRLADCGLSVRRADPAVDPVDTEGLPALRVLSDPVACARLLEPALRASGWPGLRLEEVVPRVARLKPGRRATLVHRLSYAGDADPGWPARVVTKTYRDADGAETYRWMEDLWHSRLGGSAAVGIARPLAWWPEHRTLLQAALPGDRTLADVLTGPAGSPGRREALAAAAEGLAALHACGVDTGPLRTPASDAAAARRLLGRLQHSLPAARLEAAGRLLDGAARLVSRDHVGVGPVRVNVPVHGAFRPAQVLLGEDRPGFLDFDGFGRGEGAGDVGRFLARTDDLLGEGPDREVVAATFVERYRATTDLSADRVARFVVLDHAVAAVRAWYRGQDERSARLLGLLVEALGRAGRHDG